MIRTLAGDVAALVRIIVRVALVAGWTSVVAMSPSGGNALPSGPDGHELSLSYPTAEQPVDVEDASASAAKFVQVEITQVRNPSRVPVSFTVAFRDARGERTDLGSFSLFPPDHPGRFIVATQGKVHGRGDLIVTLVPLGPIREPETLRVQLRPLALVPG